MEAEAFNDLSPTLESIDAIIMFDTPVDFSIDLRNIVAACSDLDGAYRSLKGVALGFTMALLFVLPSLACEGELEEPAARMSALETLLHIFHNTATPCLLIKVATR